MVEDSLDDKSFNSAEYHNKEKQSAALLDPTNSKEVKNHTSVNNLHERQRQKRNFAGGYAITNTEQPKIVNKAKRQSKIVKKAKGQPKTGKTSAKKTVEATLKWISRSNTTEKLSAAVIPQFAEEKMAMNIFETVVCLDVNCDAK